MFVPVFLNADNQRETDFVVFVAFRRALKALLRGYHAQLGIDGDNIRNLIRNLKNTGAGVQPPKGLGKITNAGTCGEYMARLTINALVAGNDVSGIINDAPKTGKAIDKIIYALQMFDSLGDFENQVKTIENFLITQGTLIVD